MGVGCLLHPIVFRAKITGIASNSRCGSLKFLAYPLLTYTGWSGFARTIQSFSMATKGISMTVMSILTSAAERIGIETVIEPSNAIDLLEVQHREVEALFKQLEETSDRAYKAREHLFEEIAQKLTHHAKIEEKLFYPEGREADKDLTLE
ncbi:MAG: hemerythrin domain-containing protein, partial [Proteobacteria bacterium]